MLQLMQANRKRSAETLLLTCNYLHDVCALVTQLCIVLTHDVDHGISGFGQEGMTESENLALIGGAAQDTPQHVITALVTRPDTVGDKEGDGAAMVGDGMVSRTVLLVMAAAFAEQLHGA